MLIDVKQTHIDEGDRASCAYCPVALAAREQHGILEEDITVAEHGVMWARDRWGRMRKYRLPRAACHWIDTFDRGTEEERAALKPFSFNAIRN